MINSAIKIKKAQASTELLIMLAAGLAILSIVFVVSSKTTSFKGGEFEISKARSVVNDLADAADLVFKQGVGSKTKLYVNFPHNVKSINLSGQTILLNIDVSGGMNIYRTVDFTINNGTISTSAGNRILYVIAGEKFVFVTENVSQLAAICNNNKQESYENCDGDDLNGNKCTSQGYDSGNLSCKLDCSFNFSECSGGGTNPDSITNLNNLSEGISWIFWNWTNPTNADFSKNIVFLDGSNLVNTSNSFYNATGLTSNVNYTITVHTKDSGENINNTDINSTSTTLRVSANMALFAQSCVAEDRSSKGTFGGSCDGIYSGLCNSTDDLLSCNDGFSETHVSDNVGGTRRYAGVNISSFNSSVNNCTTISNVKICYEWWRSDTLQDCDVSVDADGGSSYTILTTTCPGTTTNPGVTCTDVTGLESWTCNSFFGISGTRASVKSEAQNGGSAGDITVTWDALYFNVTYATT